MSSRTSARRRAHAAEGGGVGIARGLSNVTEGFRGDLAGTLSERASALGYSAEDLADRVRDESRSWIRKVRRQARRRPAAFAAVIAASAALVTAAVAAMLARRS